MLQRCSYYYYNANTAIKTYLSTLITPKLLVFVYCLDKCDWLLKNAVLEAFNNAELIIVGTHVTLRGMILSTPYTNTNIKTEKQQSANNLSINTKIRSSP